MSEKNGEETTEPNGEGGGETNSNLTPSEKKRLHDEAAKYRVAAKKEREEKERLQAELDGLKSEAGNGNNETRIELAFYKTIHTFKVKDVEPVLKLLIRDLVEVDPEGTVSGMEDSIQRTLERYPYLSSDEGSSKTQPDTSGPSSKPFNGPRKQDSNLDRSALERRFPALRGRQR